MSEEKDNNSKAKAIDAIKKMMEQDISPDIFDIFVKSMKATKKPTTNVKETLRNHALREMGVAMATYGYYAQILNEIDEGDERLL